MPQYQGIWTLAQQAQAQTNQQWVTDPDFKNTTLLLQADGTGSGSQNHDFRDSSTNNFFVTRHGKASQGSFSPFSKPDGEWSNFFNGTSAASAIVTAANANLFIGTGDVTVEFWMNTRLAVDNGLFGTTNEAAWNDNSWSFVYNTNVLSLYNGNGGGILWNITTGTLHDGIWHHIAIVRSSGIWQVFVDGVSKGTTATQGTRSLGNNTWRFAIGNIEPGNSDLKYTGYFSNFRFNNTAVYTSNFTPSTRPLTAIAGTKFLTCQSNRFLDNSTNALTFTAPGAPLVQAFSPFASRQWTSDVVGGSLHNGAAGDGVSFRTSSTQFGISGDFTMECWVYPLATSSSYNTIFTLNSSNSSDSGSFGLYYNGSYNLFWLNSGAGGNGFDAGTGINIVPYQWNHIVISRASSTIRCWTNGVMRTSGWGTGALDGTQRFLYVTCNRDLGDTVPGYTSGFRLVNGTAVYSGASNFTPPSSPPTNIANTAALVNSTNAGVYDATMNTQWHMTKVSGGTPNNVQVSTLPTKSGSGSIYFDGTAYQNLLPAQNYPQFTFGTNDFTLECWLYCIGKGASSGSGIWDQRPGVNGTYINWNLDFGGYSSGSASAPRLVLYADSGVFISSNVVPISQWVHIALCRANGYTRMFINGQLACTPTADTKNYISGGSAGNFRPSIGSFDGGDSLNGYIDDFRVSRFARYIANFTPPQQALPRQ